MVNGSWIRFLFLTLWVAGGVIVAAAGVTLAGPDSNTDPITVMSFNIRYDNPGDGDNRWELRKDAVAQQIRDLDPEILCLQEALRHQLDELETLVPGYLEIGVGRDDGVAAGEYSAILVKPERFSVVRQGTWWLADKYAEPGATSYGNTIPRIVTGAVLVDSSGDTLSVFNTHLDHQSQESRAASVMLIRFFLWQNGTGPIILTGDFNAGEDNPALQPLYRTYPLPGQIPDGHGETMFVTWEDADQGVGEPWHEPFRDTFRVLHPDADNVGTYNSWTGDRSGDKIDYVFVSTGWEVLESGILNETVNGRYTSDHFPVYATLKLAGPDPE
ncbi:endonuclease/exonuclease/phosphatase family protein [bacterium]|nr:endonuclease/exonuclease/phosphatase family protein [bacterium]